MHKICYNNSNFKMNSSSNGHKHNNKINLWTKFNNQINLIHNKCNIQIIIILINNNNHIYNK